jgi:hypothetical protein
MATDSTTDPQSAATATAPVTQPVESGGNMTAGSRTSSTSGTTKQTTSATAPAGVVVQGSVNGCTGPDPFRRIGGVGLCVNGEWLALWTPKGKK